MSLDAAQESDATSRTEPDQSQDTGTDQRPELDQRLQQHFANSVATPNGRAFYAPGDTRMVTAAQSTTPDPNAYTFDAHGNANGPVIDGDPLSAADVASLIRNDPNWNNQPVRLMSCEAGTGDFAQQLANELGVPVVAPDQVVWSRPDGSTFVSSIASTDPQTGLPVATRPHDGSWQTFTPATDTTAPTGVAPDTLANDQQASQPPTDRGPPADPSSPRTDDVARTSGVPQQLAPSWERHQWLRTYAADGAMAVDRIGNGPNWNTAYRPAGVTDQMTDALNRLSGPDRGRINQVLRVLGHGLHPAQQADLARRPVTGNDLRSTGLPEYNQNPGLADYDAAVVNAVDSAYRQAAPSTGPVRLHRQIVNVTASFGRNHNLRGVEFTDNGFASTSTVPGPQVGGFDRAEMTVYAANGARLVATEQGVVLPRGSRFRIISESHENGVLRLEAELIGGPSWDPASPTPTTPAPQTPAATSDPTTAPSPSTTTPSATDQGQQTQQPGPQRTQPADPNLTPTVESGVIGSSVADPSTSSTTPTSAPETRSPSDSRTETDEQRHARLRAEAVGGDLATERVGNGINWRVPSHRPAEISQGMVNSLQRYTGNVEVNGALRALSENLTPEQQAALANREITSDELLDTGVYHDGVPPQYHAELANDIRAKAEADARMATEIDEAFRHAKPSTGPVKLHRVLDGLAMFGRDHDLKGLVFREPGYSSTSTDPGVYRTGQPVEMTIYADTGSRLLSLESISHKPWEKEVLLPRGSVLKIISERVNSRGVVELEVELIGGPAVDTATPQAPATSEDAQTPQQAPTPVADMSGYRQVGPRMGSNDGGVFVDPSGQQSYVKAPPTESHARNEVLANNLYRLAGVAVPQVDLVNVESHFGVQPIGVRSQLIDGTNELEYRRFDESYVGPLRADFAIDAWLGNWDVVGTRFDNVITRASDGQPIRIDAGGALLYSAQGDPKGARFGETVTEIDTLRDPSRNYAAATVYRGVTDADIRNGVARIAQITPQQIADAVAAAGFTGQEATHLTDVLTARRQNLIDRFGSPTAPGAVAPGQPAAPGVANIRGGRHAAPRVATSPYTQTGEPGANQRPAEYRRSVWQRVADFFRGETDAQLLAEAQAYNRNITDVRTRIGQQYTTPQVSQLLNQAAQHRANALQFDNAVAQANARMAQINADIARLNQQWQASDQRSQAHRADAQTHRDRAADARNRAIQQYQQASEAFNQGNVAQAEALARQAFASMLQVRQANLAAQQSDTLAQQDNAQAWQQFRTFQAAQQVAQQTYQQAQQDQAEATRQRELAKAAETQAQVHLPTRQVLQHAGQLQPGRITWEWANSDVGRPARPATQESALTGTGHPPSADNSRPYDQPGGLRRPLHAHQRMLERIFPRSGGRFMRAPDPTGNWVRMINRAFADGDPTRWINCNDAVLSLFESFVHGRPRVAAPRTMDGYAFGDVNRPLNGENDGPGRVERVTGGRYQSLVGDVSNLPTPQAQQQVQAGFDALRQQLLQGGHGSFASIITAWRGGDSHAWAAVNHNGTIYFIDPQSSEVTQHNPMYGHQGGLDGDITMMDALVVDGNAQPRSFPGLPRGTWSSLDPTPESLASLPPQEQAAWRKYFQDLATYQQQQQSPQQNVPLPGPIHHPTAPHPSGQQASSPPVRPGTPTPSAPPPGSHVQSETTADASLAPEVDQQPELTVEEQAQQLADQITDLVNRPFHTLTANERSLVADAVAELMRDGQVLPAAELQARLTELATRAATVPAEPASMPRLPRHIGQIVQPPESVLDRIAETDDLLADRLRTDGVYVNLNGEVDLSAYAAWGTAPITLADQVSSHDLSTQEGRAAQLWEDRQRARSAFREANFEDHTELATHDFHYTDAGTMVLVPNELTAALRELGGATVDPAATTPSVAPQVDENGDLVIHADRPALPAQDAAKHVYGRPQLTDGSPPPLFDGAPTREQTQQGALGDCGIAATIGAVAGHHPELIQQLVRDNGDGTYTVTLHETAFNGWESRPTGRKIHVVVTPDIPVHANRPTRTAFMNQNDVGVAWASLVEKAVAAVDQAWNEARQDRSQRFFVGSDPNVAAPVGYARLGGGSVVPMLAELLTQLTGTRATAARFDENDEAATLTTLRQLLAAGSPVLVGVAPATGNPHPHGLVGNHVYEVVAVTDDGMIQLRNPWNSKHPSLMPASDFLTAVLPEYSHLPSSPTEIGQPTGEQQPDHGTDVQYSPAPNPAGTPDATAVPSLNQMEAMERELGREMFADPTARDAAVAALDRLVDVLSALNGVPRSDVEAILFQTDVRNAGQVAPMPLAELRATGNLRMIMTALYNGAVESHHELDLNNTLTEVLQRDDWQARVEAAGLDAEALRPYRNQLVQQIATNPNTNIMTTSVLAGDSPRARAIAAEHLLSQLARSETDLQPTRTRADLEAAGAPLHDAEYEFLRQNDRFTVTRRHTETVPVDQLPRRIDGEPDIEALRQRPGVVGVQVDADVDAFGRQTIRAVTVEVATEHEINPRDHDLPPGHVGPELPLGWVDGSARYRIDPMHEWYQDVSGQYRLPVASGLSGTAARLLSVFTWLGSPGGNQDPFVHALLGWMLPSREHSLYEVLRGLQIAEPTRFGLPNPTGEPTDALQRVPGLSDELINDIAARTEATMPAPAPVATGQAIEEALASAPEHWSVGSRNGATDVTVPLSEGLDGAPRPPLHVRVAPAPAAAPDPTVVARAQNVAPGVAEVTVSTNAAPETVRQAVVASVSQLEQQAATEATSTPAPSAPTGTPVPATSNNQTPASQTATAPDTSQNSENETAPAKKTPAFLDPVRSQPAPDEVMAKAREVVTNLAEAADVRSIVHVDGDIYTAHRNDGSSFTFDVTTGTLTGDTYARHTTGYVTAGVTVDFRIVIAANASESTVERQLARHIAELGAIGTNGLFTPTEQGQLADAHVLASWYADGDPRMRMDVRHELATLANELDLRANTDEARARMAAVPDQVRVIVEDATNNGVRRWMADRFASSGGTDTRAQRMLDRLATAIDRSVTTAARPGAVPALKTFVIKALADEFAGVGGVISAALLAQNPQLATIMIAGQVARGSVSGVLNWLKSKADRRAADEYYDQLRSMRLGQEDQKFNAIFKDLRADVRAATNGQSPLAAHQALQDALTARQQRGGLFSRVWSKLSGQPAPDPNLTPQAVRNQPVSERGRQVDPSRADQVATDAETEQARPKQKMSLKGLVYQGVPAAINAATVLSVGLFAVGRPDLTWVAFATALGSAFAGPIAAAIVKRNVMPLEDARNLSNEQRIAAQYQARVQHHTDAVRAELDAVRAAQDARAQEIETLRTELARRQSTNRIGQLFGRPSTAPATTTPNATTPDNGTPATTTPDTATEWQHDPALARFLQDVASDAGVRSVVALSEDTWLVRRKDDTTFTYRPSIQPTVDGTTDIAQERRLAKELAELANVSVESVGRGDLLTPGTLPTGADASLLSARDQGYVAELQTLARHYLDASPRTRLEIRGELARLVNTLGLRHADGPARIELLPTNLQTFAREVATSRLGGVGRWTADRVVQGGTAVADAANRLMLDAGQAGHTAVSSTAYAVSRLSDRLTEAVDRVSTKVHRPGKTPGLWTFTKRALAGELGAMAAVGVAVLPFVANPTLALTLAVAMGARVTMSPVIEWLRSRMADREDIRAERAQQEWTRSRADAVFDEVFGELRGEVRALAGAPATTTPEQTRQRRNGILSRLTSPRPGQQSQPAAEQTPEQRRSTDPSRGGRVDVDAQANEQRPRKRLLWRVGLVGAVPSMLGSGATTYLGATVLGRGMMSLVGLGTSFFSTGVTVPVNKWLAGKDQDKSETRANYDENQDRETLRRRAVKAADEVRVELDVLRTQQELQEYQLAQLRAELAKLERGGLLGRLLPTGTPTTTPQGTQPSQQGNQAAPETLQQQRSRVLQEQVTQLLNQPTENLTRNEQQRQQDYRDQFTRDGNLLPGDELLTRINELATTAAPVPTSAPRLPLHAGRIVQLPSSVLDPIAETDPDLADRLRAGVYVDLHGNVDLTPFAAPGVAPVALSSLPAELQQYFDDSTALPNGRAYYQPGDTRMINAALATPRAADGAYTFDAHGNANGPTVDDRPLSVQDVASLIRNDPSWNGQPVRLMVCYANDFAQQLANELGVTVTAPNAGSAVWSLPDGRTFVSSIGGLDPQTGLPTPTQPHNGWWDTFTPGGTAPTTTADQQTPATFDDYRLADAVARDTGRVTLPSRVSSYDLTTPEGRAAQLRDDRQAAEAAYRSLHANDPDALALLDTHEFHYVDANTMQLVSKDVIAALQEMGAVATEAAPPGTTPATTGDTNSGGNNTNGEVATSENPDENEPGKKPPTSLAPVQSQPDADTVMATARAVATTLAPVADVRSIVGIGEDTYLVRRHDDTVFTVNVRTAAFSGDTRAQHTPGDPNAATAVDFHVTIAENASESTVARELARHIAELAATGTTNGFTATQQGQLADLRMLTQWYGDASPRMRLEIRQAVASLVDPLGLRPGTPDADSRLATLSPDVRALLADVGRGRFGRWTADRVISVASAVSNVATQLSLHAVAAGWTSVANPGLAVAQATDRLATAVDRVSTESARPTLVPPLKVFLLKGVMDEFGGLGSVFAAVVISSNPTLGTIIGAGLAARGSVSGVINWLKAHAELREQDRYEGELGDQSGARQDARFDAAFDRLRADVQGLTGGQSRAEALQQLRDALAARQRRTGLLSRILSPLTGQTAPDPTLTPESVRNQPVSERGRQVDPSRADQVTTDAATEGKRPKLRFLKRSLAFGALPALTNAAAGIYVGLAVLAAPGLTWVGAMGALGAAVVGPLTARYFKRFEAAQVDARLRFDQATTSEEMAARVDHATDAIRTELENVRAQEEARQQEIDSLREQVEKVREEAAKRSRLSRLGQLFGGATPAPSTPSNTTTGTTPQWQPDAALTRLLESVASAAGVRSVVAVSENTFLVRRTDDTTFTFDASSLPARNGQPTFTLERQLARQIAELAHVSLGSVIRGDLLTPGPLPANVDPDQLSARDQGRMAELRAMARQYLDADPQTRLAIRGDLTQLVDTLGLRGDNAAARRDLLPADVRSLVDEVVTTSRLGGAGRWAADRVISGAVAVADVAGRLSLHATQAGVAPVAGATHAVSRLASRLSEAVDRVSTRVRRPELAPTLKSFLKKGVLEELGGFASVFAAAVMVSNPQLGVIIAAGVVAKASVSGFIQWTKARAETREVERMLGGVYAETRGDADTAYDRTFQTLRAEVRALAEPATTTTTTELNHNNQQRQSIGNAIAGQTGQPQTGQQRPGSDPARAEQVATDESTRSQRPKRRLLWRVSVYESIPSLMNAAAVMYVGLTVLAVPGLVWVGALGALAGGVFGPLANRFIHRHELAAEERRLDHDLAGGRRDLQQKLAQATDGIRAEVDVLRARRELQEQQLAALRAELAKLQRGNRLSGLFGRNNTPPSQATPPTQPAPQTPPSQPETFEQQRARVLAERIAHLVNQPLADLRPTERLQVRDYQAEFMRDGKLLPPDELVARVAELQADAATVPDQQASAPRLPRHAGQVVPLPESVLDRIAQTDPRLADRLRADGVYVNLHGVVNMRAYGVPGFDPITLGEQTSHYDLSTEEGRAARLWEDRERARATFRLAHAGNPDALALLGTHDFHYTADTDTMVLVHNDLVAALRDMAGATLDPSTTPTSVAPVVDENGDLVIHADRIAQSTEHGTKYPYGVPHLTDGSTPPLFNGDPTREQTQQGGLGNCGYVASLGAVAARHPELIQRMIRDNGDGTFTVTLHETEFVGNEVRPTGRRIHVIVTPDVPVYSHNHNEAAYMNQNAAGVSWASLVEKALAALDQAWTEQRRDWWQGRARTKFSPDDPNVAGPTGYARLGSGTRPVEQAEALANITGMPAQAAVFDTTPGNEVDALVTLNELLEANRTVIITTFAADHYPTGAPMPHGLVAGHAYEVASITDDGKIQLRNPWNSKHPTPMTAEEFLKNLQAHYAHQAAPQPDQNQQSAKSQQPAPPKPAPKPTPKQPTPKQPTAPVPAAQHLNNPHHPREFRETPLHQTNYFAVYGPVRVDDLPDKLIQRVTTHNDVTDTVLLRSGGVATTQDAVSEFTAAGEAVVEISHAEFLDIIRRWGLSGGGDWQPPTPPTDVPPGPIEPPVVELPDGYDRTDPDPDDDGDDDGDGDDQDGDGKDRNDQDGDGRDRQEPPRHDPDDGTGDPTEPDPTDPGAEPSPVERAKEADYQRELTRDGVPLEGEELAERLRELAAEAWAEPDGRSSLPKLPQYAGQIVHLDEETLARIAQTDPELADRLRRDGVYVTLRGIVDLSPYAAPGTEPFPLGTPNPANDLSTVDGREAQLRQDQAAAEAAYRQRYADDPARLALLDTHEFVYVGDHHDGGPREMVLVHSDLVDGLTDLAPEQEPGPDEPGDAGDVAPTVGEHAPPAPFSHLTEADVSVVLDAIAARHPELLTTALQATGDGGYTLTLAGTTSDGTTVHPTGEAVTLAVPASQVPADAGGVDHAGLAVNLAWLALHQVALAGAAEADEVPVRRPSDAPTQPFNPGGSRSAIPAGGHLAPSQRAWDRAALLAALTGQPATAVAINLAAGAEVQVAIELHALVTQHAPVLVGLKPPESFPGGPWAPRDAYPGVLPGLVYELVSVSREYVELRKPWQGAEVTRLRLADFLAASDGYVTHLAGGGDMAAVLTGAQPVVAAPPQQGVAAAAPRHDQQPAAPAPPVAIQPVPPGDAEFFAVYASAAAMDEPGVMVCRTVAQGQQVDVVYTRDGMATPAVGAVERYAADGYPVVEIVPLEATEILRRWGIGDPPAGRQ